MALMADEEKRLRRNLLLDPAYAIEAFQIGYSILIGFTNESTDGRKGLRYMEPLVLELLANGRIVDVVTLPNNDGHKWHSAFLWASIPRSERVVETIGMRLTSSLALLSQRERPWAIGPLLNGDSC